VIVGDSESFGKLLRRYRLAARLSQERLAERAGISVRGLSDLERGRSRAPRLETLALLGEALGLEGTAHQALGTAAGYPPVDETRDTAVVALHQRRQPRCTAGCPNI
jgi:transcriptional regulator with XRE-family HTH domain